jgi:hypothetical protein
MSLSEEEKQKKELNKYFKGIGQENYSTSLDMKFTMDGVNVFNEEPEGTFTSLNFMSKIFKKIRPSLYLKIINKKQAIRFIRITEQYLLLTRGPPLFTFLIPDNFPFEIKNNDNGSLFIRRINKKFQQLKEKYNISEKDIIDDMPDVLKLTEQSNSNSSSSNSSSNSSSSSKSSSNKSLPKEKPNLKLMTFTEPVANVPTEKAPVNIVPVNIVPINKVTEPALNEPQNPLLKSEVTNKDGLTPEIAEYIEDDTEMFEYELSVLNKEDKQRIEERIKEDLRTYTKDIKLIEQEADVEVDAYIQATVNRYKNDLIHWYKHTKYPYDEERRIEYIDLFKLRLPNIRNRHFLSEYIKAKVNVAKVLKIRQRMEEHPREKYAHMGINLKHYSLKDRRDIQTKMAQGVPIEQLRRQYRPTPRKAQRPKQHVVDLNAPNKASEVKHNSGQRHKTVYKKEGQSNQDTRKKIVPVPRGRKVA